jgi:uncharacterized protein with HEPN domain
MSQPDDHIRLRHMLDSACQALDLTQNKIRENLESDPVLSLALVRLLEIVGEAANRVSHNTRLRHPAIPWSQIVGLRNRLVHGYDSVDMDVVWMILTTDLPPLVAQLEAILAAEHGA